MIDELGFPNKDLGYGGKTMASGLDLTGSGPTTTPDHHHQHHTHPSSSPSSLLHTKLQISEIDIMELRRSHPSIYEAVLTLPRNLCIRSANGLSMTKKFYKGMWNDEKWLRRWLRTRKRASKLPALTIYLLNLQAEMKRFLTWDFIIRECAYYQRPADDLVDIELREDLRAYPKKTKEEEEMEKKATAQKVESEKFKDMDPSDIDYLLNKGKNFVEVIDHLERLGYRRKRIRPEDLEYIKNEKGIDDGKAKMFLVN